MPSSELLEGLVPQGLSGPPRLSSCLGLFISPDGIQLAAVSVKGGKPSVDKVVTVPFVKLPEGEGAAKAPQKRGFFSTDFLSNKEMVVSALNKGLEELGVKTRDVVVSLSHQLSITRYFLMPPVEKRFWKMSVPMEAKKYVPFPLDGLAQDFQVTSSISETKKHFMGVLLGVTPQLALGQITGLLQGAGLNIIAVEPSHCSVLRLWRTLGFAGGDGEANLQVHFEAARAHVILTRQGLPLLCREVDLPQDEYALSQKSLDLTSAVNFADKYLGIEEVQKVKVSGANDAPRLEMITREVQIPVEKADLGPAVQAAAPQWGAFAASGAAVRALGESPIVVDFTQTGRMRDEDKALILIWSAGALAFVLFALLGLFNQYQIIRAKKEMARLTRVAAEAGVTSGMSASDLHSKNEFMKQLVDTMSVLTEREALAPKLQQIVDRIPERIWLENISFDDPLKPGEAIVRAMQLQGAAQYGSRERDIMEANAFKEALLADPVFFKGFKKMDISYKASAGAAAQSGAMQTEFSLTAGQEKK